MRCLITMKRKRKSSMKMNQLKVTNKRHISNSCIEKDFLNRVEKAFKVYIEVYNQYCHPYIKEIEEFLYSLPIENSENFLYDVRQKISRFILDIITHSSLNNEFPKYDSKTYQYLYDYNGRIKVIAKQYPPHIPKGSKRNTESFKSYEGKLYNSISRSKQRVYEYALCNDWEYFVTFTINQNYFDRYDFNAYKKAFTKWLSNYSARKTGGVKIKYVLVPELGKNGVWHFHGLMSGIPLDHLSPFEPGEHSQQLIDENYLNWNAYEKKFGYCSFGQIQNIEKVAGYITKSITKSPATQMRKLHSKLFYSTKNLARPTEIGRGYNLVSIDKYDYENEYVGSKWLTNIVTYQN